MEIFENDLIASIDSAAAIRRRLDDLGISVDLYQPFRDAEGAPARPVRQGRTADAEHKLDLMAELGAPMILVCSSVAPDTIDDDDLAAEQLHVLAELAAQRGMRIAYEALAWGRHVSTWDHSWRIVERADHPALGLCLDSFHVLSRTTQFDDIGVDTRRSLFFVQLADAPRLAMDVLQWSRHHRLFPLQGGLDLVGFTRAVAATGYAGPLSLEVFNDVFRQSDPQRTAVDAMRSLIAWRTRCCAAPVGPATLVPAPTLSGFAFVELGVDGESGPELQRHADRARLLPHRSAPLEAGAAVAAGSARGSC